LAHKQAQDVRLFPEFAMAGPIADPFDPHRRQGTELLYQRRQNGGAGGRSQFCLDGRLGQGDTLQKFCGRRSGDRQSAVLCLHPAAANRRRGSLQSIDPQHVQPHGHPTNIHNGIHRPDFVEMDLFDGCAVDFGLGLGQPVENFQGGLLLPIGEPTSLNDGPDMVQVAMTALRRMFHGDLQSPNAVFFHFDRCKPSIQAQRTDRRIQVV